MTGNSDYHQAKVTIPTFRILFTRPSKVLSSADVPKQLDHGDTVGVPIYTVSSADSGANGDKYFLYFYTPTGTETIIEISTLKAPSAGKWDLYVNGSVDTTGYDDYAAADAPVIRRITLSSSLLVGENLVELRVNGKNGASSGYYINVFGVSIS